MSILKYIAGEIGRAGVFVVDTIQIDKIPEELYKYAQSVSISRVPGLPTENEYVRDGKDVQFGFLIQFKAKRLTDAMRDYNNGVFDKLSDWMDAQNRRRVSLPPIDGNKRVLKWAVLDNGYAAEADAKGLETYAIQCSLWYELRYTA